MKVELAVYDLSRGLASTMSMQLLGSRIDGIWHTGVVVYGHEYYFGGGIQYSPYGSFSSSQGLYPVQLLDMGETSQTRESLQRYISSINHRFTAMTYDLLTNNCNNFSDTICRFLCGRGIPTYIVDLPTIVMSTPGGQAFRPMIEQMQASVRMQSGASVPFGDNAYTNSTSSTPMYSNTNTTTTTTTSNITFGNTTINATNTVVETPPKILVKASLEEQPLVSSDSASVKVLCPKLLGLPLSDADKNTINTIVDAITSTPIDHARLTQTEFATVHTIMNSNKSVEMTCLFLLRLMVIPSQTACYSTATIDDIVDKLSLGEGSFSSVSSLVMAICTLANFLSHGDGISYVCKNSMSLTMTSSSSQGASSISIGQEVQEANGSSPLLIDKLVDGALKLSSHSRAEVRQMVFALLYNIVLIHTRESTITITREHPEEIPQHVIEVMCSCIQAGDERDQLVRRRQLSIVLRIIRRFGEQATQLLVDLDYVHVLGAVLMLEGGGAHARDAHDKAIVAEIMHHMTKQ